MLNRIIGWSIRYRFAVIVGWWGLSLLVRATKLYLEGRERRRQSGGTGPDGAGNPAPEADNRAK